MEDFARGLRHYILLSSATLDAHKKHPVVEGGKVLLSVLLLREDIRRTSKSPADAADFPKRHPLATWLSAFLTAYAGSVLSCFLMGESVAKPFCNPMSLMYVTAAWYVVFYSPFDLVGRFANRFPFNAALAICSELYRQGNVQSGVRYALKSSLARDVKLKQVLMLAVGTAKGSGGSFVRALVRLLRSGSIGDGAVEELPEGEKPALHEILSLSFFTKLSFGAALVWTLFWTGQLPAHMDYAMLNVSIHFFCLTQRLLLTLAPKSKDQVDPFSAVEGFVCQILLGKSKTLAAEEAAAEEAEEKEREEKEKEEERKKEKKEKKGELATTPEDGAEGESPEGLRRRGKDQKGKDD